jgi:hypothetical protein
MPARHGVRQRTKGRRIKKANERFELIASATNDALFELDFISGENWHNKVSYNNLNSYGDDYPLRENKALWRSKLHPDDRARVIKSIEGGDLSFFKSRWYLW